MPAAGADEPGLRKAIRRRLADTRTRTLTLLDAMEDEHLHEQPEPTMGVPAWDVGHIGTFEHTWLIAELGGEELDADRLKLYDPLEHPRSERGQLDVPDRDELRAFLDDVREQALATLDTVDLADGDDLVRDGFVHDMVVRHEGQHRETVLATLQLFEGDEAAAFTPPDPATVPEASADVDGMVEVPGGRFTLGTERRVGTYDNEWPAHEVEIEPFRIDRAPVTNAEFRAFVEDGGYEDPAHWSEDGWLIREALDLEHPKYWTRTDDGWQVRRFDRTEPLPEDEPVVHVSYYEAEAYASWAGQRLPTEAEWEAAACWAPDEDAKHRFPWGDEAWTPGKANLGQRSFRPAPVGAYPEGSSPLGCHQMVGDVWEWTGSEFTAHPGFEAFPYPEYSAEHVDQGFQVLKGGSWATMPSCGHATFRNWHQPDHQQIFAGFRCARDRE
jgi:iron(II)-dependent oxidoreductase